MDAAPAGACSYRSGARADPRGAYRRAHPHANGDCNTNADAASIADGHANAIAGAGCR